MDDTGYENILTCGLFLGMTREEIARKTPEIVESSELGDYLALPVRTYSTGMLTRLGFAIATAIDPEILLLDEGLASGDARFAERANRRVDALCNRAVLLSGGRIVAEGAVAAVIAAYREGSRTPQQAVLVTSGPAGG